MKKLVFNLSVLTQQPSGYSSSRFPLQGDDDDDDDAS